MSSILGDWVVSTLVAVLAVAGMLLFALGASLYAPAVLGGGQRKDSLHGQSGVNPRAKMAPALARDAAGRIDLDHVGAPEFGAAVAATRTAGDSVAKRFLDVASAIGLLVVFAPMLAIVAILIKLDSPGPVLYRQRRIGRNGREFRIYKFRSMVADAEKDGARWAAKNDMRVTRIGRIIHKTRIDEIPQAINILRGEMSFVGPRPERPEFVRLLESEIPNYHLRHVVRPGITGWAQVKYVYGASVEDARVKLQYDLHYIRHFSLVRDILIMLMTVRVALFGVGSR